VARYLQKAFAVREMLILDLVSRKDQDQSLVLESFQKLILSIALIPQDVDLHCVTGVGIWITTSILSTVPFGNLDFNNKCLKFSPFLCDSLFSLRYITL
jgi:hypothetical protein